MTLSEKLIKDFESLSEDKKIEVLDFIDFLKNREQYRSENTMDLIITDNNQALKEINKQLEV
ncbi:MAG: DUF2281 domain-containing protein [Clostridium sp.]|uniref:DUF2281 domain-containing protein n=1 Tax=Clostridium sp. TaxID=1506 RepID=UPI003D6DA694